MTVALNKMDDSITRKHGKEVKETVKNAQTVKV
jgi:hypothetical protein